MFRALLAIRALHRLALGIAAALIVVYASTSWIEARLLEGMQPDQPSLDALGRQRAQAVQSAVLANTAVAPERLFIMTERSASLASDGRVRMELKLE